MSGVYQWCGREPLTKFGMVRAMAAAFKLNIDHVTGNAEKPPEDGKPFPDIVESISTFILIDKFTYAVVL